MARLVKLAINRWLLPIIGAMNCVVEGEEKLRGGACDWHESASLSIAVSGSGRVTSPFRCRLKESEVWGMIKMCAISSAIDMGDLGRTLERDSS